MIHVLSWIELPTIENKRVNVTAVEISTLPCLPEDKIGLALIILYQKMTNYSKICAQERLCNCPAYSDRHLWKRKAKCSNAVLSSSSGNIVCFGVWPYLTINHQNHVRCYLLERSWCREKQQLANFYSVRCIFSYFQLHRGCLL